MRLDSFVDGVTKAPEDVPKELGGITDMVRAYRPKPKSKPGKKRKKLAAKVAKTMCQSLKHSAD
jgi:hypothetical protein